MTLILDPVRVVELMSGIHKVSRGADCIGYVVVAGRVSVALRGSVYNTAVEVGQSLDFDAAVGMLAER